MAKANVATKLLDNAIQKVVQNKDQYVVNPGKDFSRNRTLALSDLIRFMINMEGGSLTKELIKHFEDGNRFFTKSALVQQRQKLLSTAFLAIFENYSKSLYCAKRHKGYRLLAVDGTDVNIFPNEGDTCMYNKDKSPYSQIHLNTLYDLENKIYLEAESQGRGVMDERAALINMKDKLNHLEKMIIIADRGYECFNIMAHFVESRNLDLLLRVKDGKGAIREVRELPMETLDKDLEIGITTTQTNEDKRAKRHFIQTGSKKGKKNSSRTVISRWDFPSPYTLKIRVVRFQLNTGKYETLVTTLPRNKFSLDDLKELYHRRWGIETSFRELKYTIGLVHIKSKGVDTALQEIYISLIKYNYAESIIGDVVIHQKEENIYEYDVNHTATVYLCMIFLRKRSQAVRKLESDMARYIEPVRPGRSDRRKHPSPKSFCWFTYRVAA